MSARAIIYSTNCIIEATQLHNRSYSIATETKTYKTKFKWREGEYLSRTHYLDIPKGCHLFKP